MRRGQAYVIFGTTAGFSPTLELSALNGSHGFTLNGIAKDDFAGRAVAGVGDVNGDGLDDFLIGAPHADGNGIYRGEAYVVFGNSAGFPATFELSTLNGTNGFILNGIADMDEAGSGVSRAGDINGDAIDDLLISARRAGAGGNLRGQAYVVFGTSAGFPATFDLSALSGTNGFLLNGIANLDQAASALAGGGDINGDGLDDLFLGAPLADAGGPPFADRGQAYIVFGRTPVNYIAVGRNRGAPHRMSRSSTRMATCNSR
jgi:hypothetical protein